MLGNRLLSVSEGVGCDDAEGEAGDRQRGAGEPFSVDVEDHKDGEYARDDHRPADEDPASHQLERRVEGRVHHYRPVARQSRTAVAAADEEEKTDLAEWPQEGASVEGPDVYRRLGLTQLVKWYSRIGLLEPSSEPA